MNSEQLNIIPMTEPAEANIHQTTVLSVTSEFSVIEVAGVPRQAKVAFSCLVAPEPGDIVMYSQQETGAYYVLCIIERPDGTDMSINLHGDTTINNPSGSLSLMSKASINMVAAEKITCVSDQVIHKSREAIVDYDEVIAKGELLQASFSKINVYSQLVTTMAKQVIDRFKSYIRHSEESDHVKSGQMTREVSGLYTMDTKYTVMVSKKDTKIDGERIHMG